MKILTKYIFKKFIVYSIRLKYVSSTMLCPIFELNYNVYKVSFHINESLVDYPFNKSEGNLRKCYLEARIRDCDNFYIYIYM